MGKRGVGHGSRGIARTAGTLCLAAVAAAAGPAAGQETETIDETLPVTRDVAVEIDVPVRNVVVRGWDREELRVRGEYVPGREELDIDGEGSSVEISLDIRRGRWDRDMDVPPELVVSVPRGARLSVQVQAGGIDVQGVNGDADLESVSGDVSYAGGAATVAASSVSGDVAVEAPAATSTRAASVSGDVSLVVSGGIVEVESVSGDVDVRAANPVTRLGIEAVSGSIRAEGSPAVNASFELEAHSGAVELVLPDDLDARLEAGSFSGGIRSDFGGEVRSRSRYTPEKELRHTVGQGSARITVDTFSGEIRFLRGGGGGG